MILLEKNLCLRDEVSIDEISESLSESLIAEGVNRKQATRIRLSAEEVFLRWRDIDANGICTVYLEKKFGGYAFVIDIEGTVISSKELKKDAGGSYEKKSAYMEGNAEYNEIIKKMAMGKSGIEKEKNENKSTSNINLSKGHVSCH